MEEERGFSWMPAGSILAVAIGLSLFLLFKPTPRSPPRNDAVFGCYAVDNAPPIRLDDTGMHIRQTGFRAIGYHLEVQKTGIVLAAEQPIQAERAASFYRFSISENGIGKFLPFFRDGDDTRYRVFERNDLKSFEMVTNESDYLLYRQTNLDVCA
jgi:hypothetical protein